MKVWIKYLLGIVLGIVSAFILPLNNAVVMDVLSFLSELVMKFGKYIVVPLVFSTTIISINKLRTSKMTLKTFSWTFIVIILSSVILALIGLFSVLIVKLPRIPITVDSVAPVSGINIKGLILSLFPNSAFEAVAEGSFLLVSILFGVLIGWESASEQTAFRPIFTFFESASKLFYNIASFFTEILSVCMVALACNWFITFRTIISTGIYTPMILMFLCDFIIVIGVIYPLIIRYVCHDPNPYRVLYASLAPMLLGFISGDANLVLPLSIRHGKESLGIRRRCSGITYPFFSIFARGGTSLVVIISFILIWRSYSSLNIPFSGIIWILLISFGYSFILGGIPAGGSFVLLTIICSSYGKGFETSFLLLQPASLIICSFATVFDIATAMFGSYIVAVKTKNIEHHKIQHFI